MPAIVLSLVMVCGAILVTGCVGEWRSSSNRPPLGHGTPSLASGAPTLELLDAFVLPSIPAPPGGNRDIWFGNLSGLARDERTGRYLGVIDDRLPARVAWLDITYDERLSVKVLGVHPLVPAPGVDARRARFADLEALAALPDGSFVATEEGHVSVGAREQPAPGEWPAALLSLSPDLEVTAIHDWPPAFDLHAASGGLRDNQGAESLTLTPDGRLVSGLEQPLRADKPGVTLRNGRPFGGGSGGPSRLVEFVDTGGAWRARRQWLYPLEPTATREGFDAICDDGENGLTELLALGNETFLSLERACLLNTASGVARNTGVIYYVDTSLADDVSGLASLAFAPVRGVDKRLVLDLDTLMPRLAALGASLDNFEVLAFGPTLADGARTLLVASDDNFRATQQTVFLLFRME